MARFRQCFVDALKPKHLSSSWQINHRYASHRDRSQAALCELASMPSCKTLEARGKGMLPYKALSKASTADVK